MKYYKDKGQHFIENGNSKVRVGLMHTMGDPRNQGRVCKIFAVVEVLQQSPTNLIQRGSQVALSFSGDKANADEYVWSPLEPKFIPLKIELHNEPKPQPRPDDNIDPALL